MHLKIPTYTIMGNISEYNYSIIIAIVIRYPGKGPILKKIITKLKQKSN